MTSATHRLTFLHCYCLATQLLQIKILIPVFTQVLVVSFLNNLCLLTVANYSLFWIQRLPLNEELERVNIVQKSHLCNAFQILLLIYSEQK